MTGSRESGNLRRRRVSGDDQRHYDSRRSRGGQTECLSMRMQK